MSAALAPDGYRVDDWVEGDGCTCQSLPYPPSALCGRSPAALFRMGCVHEHVGTARLCVVHTVQLIEGVLRCPECEDLGHDCPLLCPDLPPSVKRS